MVGVYWIPCGVRASPYVIPIQSILGKLLLVPVGDTGSRKASATPFRVLPATGGRAQAMDAECGPVTSNKSHGMEALEPAGRQKVPCEQDTSACLGNATVCSGCALTILIGSLGTSRQCIGKTNIGQICGSKASRSCSCGGSKTGQRHCLFLGGAGPNGGAPTTWISQYFCRYSCLGCIRMHSSC
jgi:hypothetical protein